MSKHREPIIRTSPRPSDVNMNGNIFGGWVLAQMDIAGGITAASCAQGPVATVAIEGMKFIRPIHVGDLISCYTEVEKIGTTSIRVKIDVMSIRASECMVADAEEVKVTEGIFIFVALDEKGRPRPVRDKG